MTEKERLKELLNELGVPFHEPTMFPDLAGLKLHPKEPASHVNLIGDAVRFYFDAEGACLGLYNRQSRSFLPRRAPEPQPMRFEATYGHEEALTPFVRKQFAELEDAVAFLRDLARANGDLAVVRTVEAHWKGREMFREFGSHKGMGISWGDPIQYMVRCLEVES